MTKQRGSPDQRGMGSQSDFISESFVPSQNHKDQQLARAQILASLGIPTEEIAAMLSILPEAIPDPKLDKSIPVTSASKPVKP
jgi:hypothetical protein